jgi:hypothetical protein
LALESRGAWIRPVHLTVPGLIRYTSPFVKVRF